MTGYFAKSHAAGGSVLAWLQLCCSPDASGCILHSQLHLLLETPVYWQIHGLFRDCLFGNHPAGDGNFGCVEHSWVRAEWLLEKYFFVCRGPGLSIWIVIYVPFPYLGEMRWWAQRWSACCSHQHGWCTVCLLYVVLWLRQDVSLLPLPFMWMWLPRYLQGQRDNFVAPVGGVFFFPFATWEVVQYYRGFMGSEAGLNCLDITTKCMSHAPQLNFDRCSSFAV